MQVAYHDPRVAAGAHRCGHAAALARRGRRPPTPTSCVVTALHVEDDLHWLAAFEHVLDATYRLPLDGPRQLV